MAGVRTEDAALSTTGNKPPATGITPRNLQFEFDEKLPLDWHSGDPAITHLYDALSLTFPEGEKFFVDSVRRYVDRIEDPALLARVEDFIKQESIHAREHKSYNRLLAAHGVDTRFVDWLMVHGIRAMKRTPAKFQLAVTCADEHLTALFAEAILSDPRIMNDAHPFYQDLWRWHAMEEEEHKSVAYDVYQTVSGGVGGYLLRIAAMLFVAQDILIGVPLMQIHLMRKRGRLFDLKSWGRAFRHMWVSPGIWRRLCVGIVQYYKPGFHPDQRDPGADVLKWRALYIETRKRDANIQPQLFAAD